MNETTIGSLAILTLIILIIFAYNKFFKITKELKAEKELHKHDNCNPANTEILMSSADWVRYRCNECGKEWFEDIYEPPLIS